MTSSPATRRRDTRAVDLWPPGLTRAPIGWPGPQGWSCSRWTSPKVIAFKSTTLAQLGAEPTAERRAVGVDLPERFWPTALRDND